MAIVPLLVMAIGIVLIAVLLGVGLSNAKATSNAFKSEQHEYMVSVQKRLATWYGQNIAMESNAATSYTSDQLFVEIGVQRRYGIVLVLSPQFDDGTVRYHKVAIVVPGLSDGVSALNWFGSYDSNGVFKAPANFSFLEFDGKPLQYKALGDTNLALERVASVLEQYVSVRVHEDAGTDSTNDYFLPTHDCNHVGTRDLPCTNGYVNASQFLQTAALNGSGADVSATNAWGTDISVSNDIAENSAVAPFTMTVSTTTPWNKVLIIKAVQPIY